jgi:glycosyltransferase involved in cell wall biosynthesis
MIYQSGALQVAYSFGKPVVATNVGGLSEAVEDGETGLLVPPRDHEKLGEALIALLNDEARARRMGARAKELSETAYSWDGIARQVVTALRGDVPLDGESASNEGR